LSEIRATTISDAAGTGPITLTGQSAAKAWAWVDAYTSNTVDNSFNVSSMTDNSTGNYLVTITNGMSDGKSVSQICAYRNNQPETSGGSGASMTGTTGIRVYIRDSSGTLSDSEFGTTLHGDLA